MILRWGERLIKQEAFEVKLTPHEADFLVILARANGRVVSVGTIIDALWPRSKQTFEQQRNHIQVLLTSLRRKLVPTGLSIKTVHGLGFRLEGHLDVDTEIL